MGKKMIKTSKDKIHQLPVDFTDDDKTIVSGMETLGAQESSRKIRDGVNRGGEEERRSNMMTVQDVADYLRISRFSVYNLVKRGELPAAKVLNKFRFSPKNVEQYINKQTLNAE